MTIRSVSIGFKSIDCIGFPSGHARIFKLADDVDRPVVIHGVQHVLHPPERLERWPDGDHRTRLVFITRGIRRDELDGLLKAFTDPITGGAEAFSDDTLSLRRGR